MKSFLDPLIKGSMVGWGKTDLPFVTCAVSPFGSPETSVTRTQRPIMSHCPHCQNELRGVDDATL